jgi:putative hydroxymethylpyrimidine transporter CytX
VLGWLDYFVLWGDLGIGLLVILAGSFLVPGLGLSDALIAIIVGTVLGCLLLGLVGAIGSDTAVPTMVLLRPVLGVRGSYLPSALNILQLIGWTIFEFVIMGFAADAISKALFGVSSLPLWTGAFAAIVVLMGIGGPVGVVRQWLEKFAVWVVLATTLWLTYHLFSTSDVAALFAKPGNGSLPFWIGVDLVIAMPISWLPLVADYNRFARRTSSGFLGTFLGYLITNVWFYALGAMILLSAAVSAEATQGPTQFVSALALTAGWLALLILLVDETDNAWADLYSAAVSMQNIFPKIRQRWLILGLGAVSYLVAIRLDITQYQNFLYLAGSFFIPLFGLVLADYFVLRGRRYDTEQLYRQNGAYWFSGGLNRIGLIAWAVGVVAYHVTNPVTLDAFLNGWQKMIQSLPVDVTALGGSLPSFIVAFVVYLVLGAATTALRSPTPSPAED